MSGGVGGEVVVVQVLGGWSVLAGQVLQRHGRDDCEAPVPWRAAAPAGCFAGCTCVLVVVVVVVLVLVVLVKFHQLDQVCFAFFTA